MNLRTLHVALTILVGMSLNMVTAQAADAAPFTLTNGTLNVQVADNGTIFALQFDGREYYREGAFVSDFGFQVGTNTGTFEINTTQGGTAIAGSSTNPTWSGSYSNSGSTANVSRTYAVPLPNLLTVTISATNTGTSPLDLRWFDTLDPDQGVDGGAGFNTVNDIYNLGGFNVARATSADGYTVLFGSSPTLAFGGGTSAFGLGVSSGATLNQCFATPFDPNGANADIGVCIGSTFSLAPGQSGSYTYFQAFGATPAVAEATFLAQAGAPIPEPATVFLMATGLAGLAFHRLRRRK